MTILGKRVELPIIPAVNPLDDATALDTIFFTDTNKVRFQNGKLRKIKGWKRIFSNNDQRITGAARNIYSYRDAFNNPISIIGTHRSLFAVTQSSNFFNITPLQTTTNDEPNCFSTEYNFEYSVVVTTTLGSPLVTLNITQYLNSGDEIQISGVTNPVNGIPAANFNQIFNASVINRDAIQIITGAVATSSGTQTVTMTWATSYLYVSIDGNEVQKGDRIKIVGASEVGNIPADQINGEDIVANTVNADEFVIQTETIATSLVILGGGSDITIQYQIPQGNIDQSIGYGYGAGEYGAGQYGITAQFTNQNINSYPRIWSVAKWVNSSNVPYIIVTPGDAVGSADASGANVYAWAGDVTVAPTLITNAPYFVTWLYVSHNSICTLGGAPSNSSPSQGIPNFFSASDIRDMTIWGPLPNNYAYSTTLDNANALISQASCRGSDLLFTQDEDYIVAFVGKPNIWFFSKLLTTDGIIAPKARGEVNDQVFWQGQGDFFKYDGTSVVSILPNNTVKRYVYDNLNYAQSAKCFAYVNTPYNEVWFFYPQGQENEPNNYAMYNYVEETWTIGTLPRTAAEEPLNINFVPLMIQSNIISSLSPISINSFFFTMGTDPFATFDGTKNITFSINTTCYLQVGDYIQVSGSTDINGIPADEINGIKQIVSVNIEHAEGYGWGFYGVGLYGVSSANNVEIVIQSISTNATSSGNGGGSSITIGTAVIGIDIGSTRIESNETITLTGSPSVGGIAQQYVNVINAPVRALSGTVLQINDAAPTTIFSTSAETITDIPSYCSVVYTPSDRLFLQETGLNDYNTAFIPGVPGSDPDAPMLAYATTNMAQIGEGDETMVIYSVYPDTSQEGDLTLFVRGKLYAQSSLIYPSLGGTLGVYTITPQTTKVDLMFVARQRQYTIQSDVLNGDFLIGKWFEEVKPSSTR
jgi:hypothetical protein